MAPRGRRRKPGDTRMDAAIQHVQRIGFSAVRIRRKVRELLQVYGGGEGWFFIEEDSYKLLVESLLEDQEGEAQCEKGEPSSKGSPSESVAQASGEAGLSEVLPLCAANGTLCSDQDAVLQSPKTGVQTNTRTPELLADKLVLEPVPPPVETQISSSKNATVDKDHEVNHNHDVVGSEEIAPLIAEYLCTAPPGFKRLPTCQVFSTRKRKPCLGWIGHDNDEDFVLLEPAPWKGMNERRRKRKSRWDVTPYDPL